MAAKRTQKSGSNSSRPQGTSKKAKPSARPAPAKKASPKPVKAKPAKPSPKKPAPKAPTPKKAKKPAAPPPKAKKAAPPPTKVAPASKKPSPAKEVKVAPTAKQAVTPPPAAKGKAPTAGPPSKPGKPLTKPPKLRPGQAPPKPQPKSEATVVRTKSGEQLTLLPARSSSIGGRPSQPGGPDKATSGKKEAPRPGQKPVLTLTRTASDRPPAGFVQVSLPIPVRKLPPALTLEDRFKRLDEKIEAKDPEFKTLFYRLYDQAWVSHDSALEGNVYTREEIEAGFAMDPGLIDSNLQPAADEIRRHREAIDYVRDFGLRKKLPVTVDVIRKLYLILHPTEGDLKTVKYRKDIPQHRLYFHEYAAPDKIAYKVRLVVDWLNEPETRKTRNAIRIAARAHYDLLRVFPFQVDSGKVARLFMNLLLYRAGYPPAIIHAKERQAYYEALKGEPNKILRIVTDAVEDGLTSIEKFFEEQESKKRQPGF